MTGHISGATVANLITLIDEVRRLHASGERLSFEQWRRLLDARVELAVALPAVRVEGEVKHG